MKRNFETVPKYEFSFSAVSWLVYLGICEVFLKKPKLITTSAAPRQHETVLFSQKARVAMTDISSHTWSCSERISMVIALFWKDVCYGSFSFNTTRRNRRKHKFGVYSQLHEGRHCPTTSAAHARELSATVKVATPRYRSNTGAG